MGAMRIVTHRLQHARHTETATATNGGDDTLHYYSMRCSRCSTTLQRLRLSELLEYVMESSRNTGRSASRIMQRTRILSCGCGRRSAARRTFGGSAWAGRGGKGRDGRQVGRRNTGSKLWTLWPALRSGWATATEAEADGSRLLSAGLEALSDEWDCACEAQAAAVAWGLARSTGRFGETGDRAASQ